MVHIRSNSDQPQRESAPTRGTGPGPQIPPTQLVDRSYSPYKHLAARSPESHQRSWWIVHTRPTNISRRALPNPTNAVGGSFILALQTSRGALSRIPPTQLVDRSYPTYRASAQVPSQLPPTRWWDCRHSLGETGCGFLSTPLAQQSCVHRHRVGGEDNLFWPLSAVFTGSVIHMSCVGLSIAGVNRWQLKRCDITGRRAVGSGHSAPVAHIHLP
jgi:hypothetical protein